MDIQIPNEERVVYPSVNKGTPFVISNPTAKVSLAIRDLARIVNPQSKGNAATKKASGSRKSSSGKKTVGIFAWLFSIFVNG